MCRSYTLFCRGFGDIVVCFSDDALGVLLGGAVPEIVPRVFYPAYRESFPRRFVEGDQSSIRVVERSSAFFL